MAARTTQAKSDSEEQGRTYANSPAGRLRAVCDAKNQVKGNPVAIYHLSVKTVSRSAGRSATAAAAYRAGVEITDKRTGEIHDYTRKGGVESAELVLPAGAPEWAADRAELWNAAELAETRKNSTVAREFEIALPSELSPDERKRLAMDFAREIVERHGCAADVAIHAPGKDGDNRNHHAHILCSTRRLTPEGFGEKTRELDERKTGQVDHWRERFAGMQNERLQEAGVEVRVDHRSLEAQGIDREPTVHLGPAATGIERRTGEASRIRQDFDQAAAERLTKAKLAGELERQGQVLERSIIDLSGDLNAAKAERTRQQAAEAQKRAVEASVESVRVRYAQALKNVTIETLATVPGLLPAKAIEQGVREVTQEIQAEVKNTTDPDLDAIRRQVLADPGNQWRLDKADQMEARGKVTLEDIAGMGAVKRMLYDTKGMTEEANKLLADAKLERVQVNNAVELSDQVQAARKQIAQNVITRKQAVATTRELVDVVQRSDLGQALYARPEHVYRIPESVGRVVEKARTIAPNSLQGMQLAEVERMTTKAVDVAWTKPEKKNEFEVRVSRFVLPADERRKQQEKEQAQQKEQGQGRGR
jgi:hypothetical protein